jgi:multiple sugar transport system permease protein
MAGTQIQKPRLFTLLQHGFAQNYRQRDKLIGMLFVAPLVVYFIVFLLFPTAAALYFSFTKWNMRSDATWIGFQNYEKLFTDSNAYPYFWHSLRVTAQYVIFAVPVSLITALTLAMLINAIKRGQDFFKVAFYLPVITAEAAVGTMWRWIYDPLNGLLNVALREVGLPTKNWLGDPEVVIPALAIIAAWQCGGAMIIFLAGLKGIPDHLYEAASVDGANGLRRFRHITLPMLKPTTFYLLITGLIGGFQVFGVVYVIFSGMGDIGSGGPGRAGLTYVLYLYTRAFRYYEMGAASAMSFILFVIILIVTLIQFRFVPQSYE